MTVHVDTVSSEGAVYEWTVEIGTSAVTVMAELDIEPSGAVVLRAAHVQGDGPNTVGAARLLAALRELKAVLGVNELRIEGATRTTGANPGRTPHPIKL